MCPPASARLKGLFGTPPHQNQKVFIPPSPDGLSPLPRVGVQSSLPPSRRPHHLPCLPASLHPTQAASFLLLLAVTFLGAILRFVFSLVSLSLVSVTVCSVILSSFMSCSCFYSFFRSSCSSTSSFSFLFATSFFSSSSSPHSSIYFSRSVSLVHISWCQKQTLSREAWNNT